MREVTATEFTRNFSQYREVAQREPIAVTSHGRTIGFFVSANEFEELQRTKVPPRRNRSLSELTAPEIEAIAASRMARLNDHLDLLLDE